MKADYLKIRKFLLRMTHGENFREEEKWKTFKNISFYDFLSEVGMFQSGEDVQDHKCQLKAKQRYLNALRCGARSGGILLLKRETGDIMTNNFNKNLIQLHRANQDIQFITNEYAVAEYLSKYCTKPEAGQSALLQNINKESLETGLSSKESLRKLTKQLDKGRECSIQEAVYRVLGFTMTKFSAVVRFVNTNHPDHRDGLLKVVLFHCCLLFY